MPTNASLAPAKPASTSGVSDGAATAELVQEYVDSRGHHLAADRGRGVLCGVKLLGLTSKNGRVYREGALRSAMHLYDGAKVNVNHPAGDPLAPRDYRDRLGVIRNVSVRGGEGLFGDLHFNPKHALAEQLAWDAEHTPENVGLSHNVAARTSREGDKLVVEAIARVHSVDLVADPATTSGLFEQTASVDESREESQESPVIERVIPNKPSDELLALREEVTSLRHAVLVHEVLAEHGLGGGDDPGVDDEMRLTLEQAHDESSVRSIVERRVELLRSVRENLAERPVCESREAEPLGPAADEAPSGVTDFVAAVTRR